jgi:hypothetical protein
MENKLDPEFKAKWIAALRSGVYKQGDGKLYSIRNGTYCCLGVACVVAGHTDIPSVRTDYGEYISHRATGVPSILHGSGDLVTTLANMNDGENTEQKSFLEIADYIEANL